MKIELKGIKVASFMSRETNSFAADLYIDGKKIASAHNDGGGGMTNLIAYTIDGVDVIKKAEAFCKAMPKEKTKYGELEMSLDYYIDKIVDEFINKREQEKFEKKYQKAMLNGIIVGNPDKPGAFAVYKTQQPLSFYQPKVLLDFVEKIKAKLKEGEQIMNTNLPTA